MRPLIYYLVFASQARASLHTDLADVNARRSQTLNSGTECDCKGVEENSPKNDYYICHNSFLGPKALPSTLPILSLVSDYDRFGGRTPSEFLTKYKPYGSWAYPRAEDFQVDLEGIPIMGNFTLPKGYKVDRFGSTYGQYLSAAEAPFTQRALPPNSLNVCKSTEQDPNGPKCDPEKNLYPATYHIYEIIKELSVLGGPIAPAFGQPGGGTQFFLAGRTIQDLLATSFLKEIPLTSIVVGPGQQKKCGVTPLDCTCKAVP